MLQARDARPLLRQLRLRSLPLGEPRAFFLRRRRARREVLVAEFALERRDGRRRLIQLPVEARRLREKEQRGKS